MRRDTSLASITAGFVTVLVGITSSVAVVFAAAQALQATTAQTTSWIWALGMGMGLTSFGLAMAYRKPVLTAWSTPGAALIAGTQGLSMAEALGACVVPCPSTSAIPLPAIRLRCTGRLRRLLPHASGDGPAPFAQA